MSMLSSVESFVLACAVYDADNAALANSFLAFRNRASSSTLAPLSLNRRRMREPNAI